MPIRNPAQVAQILIAKIRKYHEDAGIMRAELDVSGGIDSAVMLMLIVQALGASNVVAVYQGINSSDMSLIRARDVAHAAGVDLVEFDGSVIFQAAVDKMIAALVEAGHDEAEIKARIEADRTILGSIRSTMRAPWGRAAGRLAGNAIRHGTGNEDEDRYLRFFQKGGDGEVDTSFLSSLSKGEIFQLACFLGVPWSILKARPSPDLWAEGEAHNDEDEIAAFLRIPQIPGIQMYSYVNYDDEGGPAYTNVGLIERIARFADLAPTLFGQDDPNMDMLARMFVATYVPNVDFTTAKGVLHNARRVEKLTRHKLNPALPTITRTEFGPGLSDDIYSLINKENT